MRTDPWGYLSTPPDPFNARGSAPAHAELRGWGNLAGTVALTRLFSPKDGSRPRQDAVRRARKECAALQLTVEQSLAGMPGEAVQGSTRRLPIALIAPCPDPRAFVAAYMERYARVPSGRLVAGRCNVSLRSAGDAIGDVLAAVSKPRD